MQDLIGLVACGGKSSRMGIDKGLLDYYGKPQRLHIYEMLEKLCANVFLSFTKEQADGIAHSCNFLIDAEQYSGIGPMASVLSAFEKFPANSFLIVGCDYPFVESKNLQQLIEGRIETGDAVCFQHPETNIHEPLIAIYEQKARTALLKNFSSGKYSLRHFLEEANTITLLPASSGFLKSVDDNEEYEQAKQKLHDT